MLTHPATEILLPRAENRYVLAMLAARRARQLTSGACPTINLETPSRVTMACEEIGAGSVVYRYGKLDVVVPEHPTIIAAREAAMRENRAKEEEERMEEHSRFMRQADRQANEEIFEKAGISVEDASLIAERLISHVTQLEQEERKAAEEAIAQADETQADQPDKEDDADEEESSEIEAQ
ncbi:MAG: DNA-directed RNA polymerase subunit omega [Clostridiaceae bacterium]|jgi:DNA-directed RNA polymerase omega subunit|nr:DNA-directed RNA polymerase subunit omega [Clostridiaceae bacterium]